MKNRIFWLIIVAALSIFAFASCGETEEICEHTFSEAWASDAANHWHAATCEHGEIKGALAAHADVDEDGKCDTCEYEVGHEHTYADEWSVDETNHWKAATCTHTAEKGELGLHADENTDGKCDVCEEHVHVLDTAGFCTGCDKEIKPIVETDIGAVISATTARAGKVVSGTIDYYQLSSFKNPDDNGVIEHVVEYYLGTNGTYSKRLYDEVETIGEGAGATVNKTGKTEILEKWVKIVSADSVTGISAISVDGVYKSAEPSSFSPDDLMGYYYAVSTLADGHGAEAVLLSLYNAYLEYGIEDAVIVHDIEANTYKFDFKALVANEITVGGEASNEYAANYYEVSVYFVYANDYTLLSLDINCDCYTNDPGSGNFNREEEIDFDYDYSNGTFTMRDEARADKFNISVTQTVGTRVEIALNDGSQFAPTDFEIYTDEGCTDKAINVEVAVGNFNTELYFAYTPELAFISFLDLDIKVTDKDGNEVNGLMVYLNGSVVSILPTVAGDYVVTFSAGSIVKTVNVTVLAEEIRGENNFKVTSTENNTFEGGEYTFVAPKSGEYTFYLPVGVSVQLYDKETEEYYVAYDYNLVGIEYGYPEEGTYSWTVTLTKREAYTVMFMFRDKDVTYTIGYDAP